MAFSNFIESSERELESVCEAFWVKSQSDPSYLDQATNYVLDLLIDEVIFDVATDHHRALRLGYSDYVGTSPHSYRYDDDLVSIEPDLEDDRKGDDIKCPICLSYIIATGFASHLAKCMGLGKTSSRISSRIASLRIANTSKDTSYVPLMVADDDKDEDWSLGIEKVKGIKKLESRKKRDKSKRTKPFKNSKEDLSFSETMTLSKFNCMAEDEKDAFLTSSCASVVDADSLCFKSLRCALHSDDDRAAARKYFVTFSNDPMIDDSLPPEIDKPGLDVLNYPTPPELTPFQKRKD